MSATSGLYVPSGEGWRLAGCLVTGAHELADEFGDELTCLGTIGNAAHAAEHMDSDHNPFIRDPHAPSIGIVRAIDLGGSDALLKKIRQHIWDMYAAHDPRLWQFGYSKGTSDNQINNWPPLAVPGHHEDDGDAGHLHISVTQVNGHSPSVNGYVAAIDSTAPWGFSSASPSSGGNTPEDDDVSAVQLVRCIAPGNQTYPQTLAIVGPLIFGVANQSEFDCYAAVNPKVLTCPTTEFVALLQHVGK